ncbi:tRNA-modifying protein YgfZ [hydrothermal vent metagenome]|uniref:tRNA-modifying protein YgfZ n=1 Tax=hydrothermal vent metagenome TaxID=652676 RepID=A0A3B1BIX6_9ZZZZ
MNNPTNNVVNRSWQNFLSDNGAEIQQDQVVSFGDPQQEHKAALTTTILADLSPQGLIKVSGEDSLDFLQNQFSNDIREINPQLSQLNAWCNAKGRMLASLRVFRTTDDYFLLLARDLLETTLKRLRMFVLRSKVMLEDVSNEWAGIGLAGTNAPVLLARHINHLPEKTNQVVHENGLVVIRLTGATPRFQIHAQTSALNTLWQALKTEATPVGYPVWNWLEIQAGIPHIVASTTEAFVPQMVNYSTLGGVSFTKGCYPGQEVVARMHYLGKLKRRMYLAHVETETLPDAGENLFPAGENEAQSCGKVVQAERSPEGGVDLLVVLQIAVAETGDICLGSENGPPLQLQNDPYPVDNKA